MTENDAMGIVGPRYAGDGSEAIIRLGRTGEQIIGDAHGRYHEATARGVVQHASMQAGATLGTALTATAVTLTLYNPAGSGVLLSLLNVSVGISTAPAGSAVLVLAANVNPTAAAPSATTAATVRNNKLGPASGRGVAYTAATLPAAPVVVRVLGSVLATGSTSGVVISDDVAGQIILPENTAITVQSIGTAPSGIVSMSWEEILV